AEGVERRAGHAGTDAAREHLSDHHEMGAGFLRPDGLGLEPSRRGVEDGGAARLTGMMRNPAELTDGGTTRTREPVRVGSPLGAEDAHGPQRSVVDLLGEARI